MDDAIPIKFTNPVLGASEDVTKREPTEQETRDAAIESLELTAGWKNLKKMIVGRQEALRNFLVNADDTPEQIGYKYVTAQSCIAELQGVIDKVEATSNHVRKQRELEARGER